MGKFELVPAEAGLPTIYAEGGWWENCLRYSCEGGWIPERPVPTDTAGRGTFPWLVYVPDLIISPDDARAMGSGLEAWHGQLKPQYNPLRLATDPELTSRIYLARWLQQAGAVHLQHGAPWRRERLAGISSVTLAIVTGASMAMATPAYYDLLEFARSAGWAPRGASNDKHTPDSLFRSTNYDVPGAIITPEDADELVAAVTAARPMIVAGLPINMLPEDMQPMARLIELHRTGKHHGAAWLRLILPE